MDEIQNKANLSFNWGFRLLDWDWHESYLEIVKLMPKVYAEEWLMIRYCAKKKLKDFSIDCDSFNNGDENP